jgi:diacylglycerol kinase (ATP)
MRDALDNSVLHARSGGLEVRYSIVETTACGSAVRTGVHAQGSGSYLARIAAEEGAHVVVAAGGDGTVGEVANGLIGTPAALGVLPMGTGNDFARTLGVGNDISRAARAIVFGTQKRVDIGRIGEGHFVNVAGCGFDAEVSKRVNRGFRRLRGTTAYIAAVFETLGTFRPAEITLEIDGVIFEEVAMLCAVANAKSYGGGMLVAPDATLDDGLFDVVVVGNVSPVEFVRAFPRVFKGTHVSHPKVTVRKGKRVAIRSRNELPVLADGEDMGVLPVEFAIAPQQIEVMFPN